MKKQLLVVPAAIATFFAAAQTEQTDLAIHNLKGKVRSVYETVYEGKEKFGELEKGTKTARFSQEYNVDGFELQFQSEYYEDGEKDKYVRTTRYENKKAVEIKEDDNGEVEVSRMKYNQHGLLESIDGVDNKNKLLYRQKNKYNTESLLVQSDSYNADGVLEQKGVKSYNANKQLVREELYNGEGKLLNVDTYAYDSRGNRVENNSYNYEKNVMQPLLRKYAFNENGQKSEERNSITGLDKKEIYEYNAQGDETRHVNGYGEEVKKVYTYDGNNNWIKCISTKSSGEKISFEITERQIRYY